MTTPAWLAPDDPLDGFPRPFVMVTGHRPQALPAGCEDWVRCELRRVGHKLGWGTAVSGMALGVDTWWAEEALAAGVPVVAAVPCPGQPDRWPAADRERWKQLLDRAAAPVLVSARYHRGVFNERNAWMVSRADAAVAVWAGKKEGGTFDAVRRLRSAGTQVVRIDPVRRTVAVMSAAPHQGTLF